MSTFVNEKITVHEKVYHPVNYFDFVAQVVDKHKADCQITEVKKKLEGVEKMMIWLVYKNNGDPKTIADLEA